MKFNYVLVLVACVLFSGCGDIEWFPDASTTNPVNPTASPRLTKAYAPAAILAGKTATLTFTITNAIGNPAQSGLGFADQLDSSLTATVSPSQCGGTVEVSNANNIIIFSGGTLAAGISSCTITASVSGMTAGSFTNKTTDVSLLQGGLVNGVTDQTLKIFPESLQDTSGTVTASNLTSVLISSDANVRTYNLSVDVANSDPTAINVSFEVEVEAVDANGIQLRDEFNNPITFIFQDIVQTTATFGPVPVDVPIATADKINFWRIVSVVII